jgi:hypothetical protein
MRVSPALRRKLLEARRKRKQFPDTMPPVQPEPEGVEKHLPIIAGGAVAIGLLLLLAKRK